MGLVQEMLSKQRTRDHQIWRKTFPAVPNADLETIASIGFGQRIQTIVGSEAMKGTRVRKFHLAIDEEDSENQVKKLVVITVFLISKYFYNDMIYILSHFIIINY